MNREIKKFLLISALFIFVLFFVVEGVNYLYLNNVELKKAFWISDSEIERYLSTNNDLDYIILGTSRTRASMNPRLIPNSINLSMAPQNFILTYYRLKYYLEGRNLKAKKLIVELDLNTLYSGFSDVNQLLKNDSKKFISFEEKKKLTGASPVRLFLQSNISFLGKAFEFYSFLRMPKTETYLGWAKEVTDFSINGYDVNVAAKECKNDECNIGKQTIEYYKKIINLADKKGIKIVFLKNPISKDLDKAFKKYGVDSSSYYDQVFKEIDSMGICYEVMDYHDLFFDRPDLFTIDGGHVNFKGSEIVSKKFVEDSIKTDKAHRNK